MLTCRELAVAEKQRKRRADDARRDLDKQMKAIEATVAEQEKSLAAHRVSMQKARVCVCVCVCGWVCALQR